MLTFPIIKIHAERNKKKIYLDHLNRSSKKKILNSFRRNFSDNSIFPYPLFFELNSNWIRSDFTKIHASITRGEMKKKGKNGEKTMSRDFTKSARWIFSIFRENPFFFFSLSVPEIEFTLLYPMSVPNNGLPPLPHWEICFVARQSCDRGLGFDLIRRWLANRAESRNPLLPPLKASTRIF